MSLPTDHDPVAAAPKTLLPPAACLGAMVAAACLAGAAVAAWDGAQQAARHADGVPCRLRVGLTALCLLLPAGAVLFVWLAAHCIGQ